MAHDEALAARIRELLAGRPRLTERRMFGGIAFLIGGNMAVSASGHGGLLVRVDPNLSQALVVSGEADLMEMRGRSMRGWLRVSGARLEDAELLARWVDRGADYADSLPVKG